MKCSLPSTSKTRSSPLLPLWPSRLSQLCEITRLFSALPPSSSGFCPQTFPFLNLITFYKLMSPELLSCAPTGHLCVDVPQAKINPIVFPTKTYCFRSCSTISGNCRHHCPPTPGCSSHMLGDHYSLSPPYPAINHRVLSSLSPGSLSNPSSYLPLHYRYLDSGAISLFSMTEAAC